MQPSGDVLVVVVALVRVGEGVVGDESVPGRLGVCVVRSVVISVVVGEVAVVVSTTVVTTAGVVPEMVVHISLYLCILFSLMMSPLTWYLNPPP